jgi:hypothetical protein
MFFVYSSDPSGDGILEISLTKDSRLLLHAIHSPLYWRILKKTMLFSVFKNPYQKIHESRKIDSFLE